MSIKVYVRSAKNGRNHQLFYVDPGTGKRHHKTAGTRDTRAAQRAAARWEDELKHQGNAEDLPWSVFREKFEDQKLVGQRIRTQQAYMSALNKLELVVGERTYISQINSRLLSEFQSIMRKEGLSEASIATYLRHIRAALNWAAKMGYLMRSPNIVMPKTTTKRLARGRPLTWQEVIRFLHAADTMGADASSWKLLIRGLYLSGLRLQEALNLSWDKPPVLLDLCGGRYPRIVWQGEGQKSGRDQVTPVTRKFVALVQGLQRSGSVFSPTIQGRPVGYDRTVRGMAEFGKIARIQTLGNKTASSHDFRRSFGQYWATRLKPLQLQKIMRHSSLETTMKYYVDLPLDDVAAELWK